ncbi:hypothetical protein Tco_0557093 [Tanacetum coccineum]
MHVTTTVFTATTPKNTLLAYHASTSTNPNPTINPAFVEVNYEILESLLKERRRQIRIEDLRTELKYFSEDYDEEREMEPRPEPHREATPTIRHREENRKGRNAEGIRPSKIEAREGENRGANLPPPLAAHLGINENRPFVDFAGSVTPFVRWIEDYPLSDGLKMPSHIGSYDGKGNPDNFFHIFEGAIRMQKWLIQQKKFTKTHLAVDNIKQREGESNRAFITRYTNDTLQILGLHEEQQISGFIYGLRTRSLVEHLSTDLPSTYKGLMEKTYTWVEAGEGPSHGLLLSLSKSTKEILTTEKAARSFEPPPKMFGSKRSWDTSKYCLTSEYSGHDTI